MLSEQLPRRNVACTTRAPPAAPRAGPPRPAAPSGGLRALAGLGGVLAALAIVAFTGWKLVAGPQQVAEEPAAAPPAVPPPAAPPPPGPAPFASALSRARELARATRAEQARAPHLQLLLLLCRHWLLSIARLRVFCSVVLLCDLFRVRLHRCLLGG